MIAQTRTPATVEDLYRVDGKAELVGGRIVALMATGRKPSRVAFRIAMSLDEYAEANGGEAYADNTGFVVPLLTSGRRSFSPDASYFVGPFPENEMRFLDGPPTFAVEVRSENDFGPAAEAALAVKRADYFEAGTLAVWDVDPLGGLIHAYRLDAVDRPATFGCGDTADAEPAVPGWRVAIDRLFA